MEGVRRCPGEVREAAVAIRNKTQRTHSSRGATSTTEKEPARASGQLPPPSQFYPQQASIPLPSTGFHPKSEKDYFAFVKATTQRRSRSHEKLVRIAGESLRSLGAEVTNLHPLDLLITSPLELLIEAKIAGKYGRARNCASECALHPRQPAEEPAQQAPDWHIVRRKCQIPPPRHNFHESEQ